MQVLVSFSTIFRFVLWLIVAGVVAGSLLVDQSGAVPAGPGEGVAVHADARDL